MTTARLDPARRVFGPFDLDLAPAVGGAAARLDWRGLPVLRRAIGSTLDAGEPRGASTFPMVPYASRLAGGRIAWGEVAAILPGNMAPEPAPLHGLGWKRPWRVEDRGPQAVAMVLDHAPDVDWPWAFEAEQTFAFEEAAVEITLALVSRDARPFGATLGHHPYFDRAGARVTAAVESLWETDGEGIPVRRGRPPALDALEDGVAVDALDLDHCLEGWSGPARIERPDLAVVMTARAEGPAGPIPVTRLQLYVPPGEAFFCLEPVTARTNALNADDPASAGATELAPGERLSLTLRLDLEAR